MNLLTDIRRGWGIVGKAGKIALDAMTKNSPAILSGMAVAGTVGSVILAVRATPKALRIIESERMAREEEAEAIRDKTGFDAKPEELTNWDIVKLGWKYYIPAALSTTGTVVCIVAAQKINGNRLSALATALSLSENARKELEEKFKEKYGEGKLGKLKDEIAADGVRKDDPNVQFVYDTGFGDTLFKDGWSGRYFTSSVNHIDRVVNDLNYRLMGGEYYISLNEWYMSIGLPPLQQGDEFGWNMHDMGKIDISYHHCSWTDDGNKVCAVLEYNVMPRYDYTCG